VKKAGGSDYITPPAFYALTFFDIKNDFQDAL